MEVQVFPLLPPVDGNVDRILRYSMRTRILRLTYKFLAYDPQIEIVQDKEVNAEVYHIVKGATMIIPGKAAMGVLIVYLKNMAKYFRLDVEIETKKGRRRRITFGNDFSAARINEKECLIPINCNFGWNYLKFDLTKVVPSAFGQEFRFFTMVQIFAECEVWKVFLEQKELLHTELPPELQVIQLNALKDASNDRISETDSEYY